MERVFGSDPDVAEAIYRLSQAAREGKRLQEEFRVQSGPRGAPAWFRIRVRPLPRPGARDAVVWTVADVTRDRERQENVFQELQHAIDFLDHAPAGFFSAETDGTISYMNATLAEWLDHDLAQIGAGTLTAARTCSRATGPRWSPPSQGAAGTVKTEALDLDLKTRGGAELPGPHPAQDVAYAADGTAAPSKTLVLDRSRAHGVADPLRAAEVQFARFFNATPIAIATVDKAGHVQRANASFARLFADVHEGRERMVLSGVAEAGRAALERGARARRRGPGDVQPVDGADRRRRRVPRASISAPSRRRRGATRRRGRDPLRARHHRAARARGADRAVAEDAGDRPARRRHRPRLQQCADRDHRLLATCCSPSHRPTDPSFRDIMQIKQNANRAAGLVRQLLAFSRRQTLRPQVLVAGRRAVRPPHPARAACSASR